MEVTDTLNSIQNTDAPVWRKYVGKDLIIHAVDGSYGAKRAAAELREGERIAETLGKLLDIPLDKRSLQVNLFLIDPVAELSIDLKQQLPLPDRQTSAAESGGSQPVVRVVSPEAPGEPLVGFLTRLFVERWFGLTTQASAIVFFEGLAGMVTAQISRKPTVQEADEWVQAELKAKHPVSILTLSEETNSENSNSNKRLASTSFITFLLEVGGATSLHHFLETYDPQRPDQAAISAYQQPLANLQETWLNKLKTPARQTSAFRAFLQELGPLLKPYWLRELEILGYMLLGLGYLLLLPLSTKFLVDNILPSRDLGGLALFLLVLFVVYVLNALLQLRRAYVNNFVNQRILYDLQESMFNRLQRLSHDFYTKAKVGDILARLSADLQIVQQAMSQVLGVGVYMALNVIAAALTVIILNPLLGLLVVAVIPFFAVSYLLLRTRIEKASLAKAKLTGEATATAQENLSAHAVIKAFGLEERAISTYHDRLQLLFKAALRLVVFGSLFETSIGLAVTLGQLIVMGVGGYLVLQNQVTIGTLLAFIGILPSLFSPVAALSNVGQVIQAASGSLERIKELLNAPISIADKPAATTLPLLSHEIGFEGVEFSYDDNQAILHNLNLVFPVGTHTAIVGPSGSGKSTIINLLLRFWDPQAGSVTFDKVDLRDVTLASLRNQCGIVFQDTFIFDTTLRENIAIGRPSASDSEIKAAAKAAQLDEYISSLPAGFDTVLGERGVRMSGGQRQRLAIARTLLRDPSVLILDEATSALDAKTESQILETLNLLTKGRTTISITHRLSLAATADRIIVVNQGEVAEQGTHTELVKAGGLYQRLFEEQVGYITNGTTRIEQEAERLKTVPLFAQLNKDSLIVLARNLVREHFNANEIVVQQATLGDKLYIIHQGHVEVLVKTGLGEQRTNTLQEGDYFGELALLSEEPRVATVRTTVPTELYSLTKLDFLALLEREPQLSETVLATVAKRRANIQAITAVK
jgi:ATP-binding cassette subfamily B protein